MKQQAESGRPSSLSWAAGSSVRRKMGLAFGACVCVTWAAFGAEDVPWTGASGVCETVADIMRREEQATLPQEARIKPVLRPDRQRLPQNLGAAELAPSAQAVQPADGSLLAVPQTASTNFTGATLSDTSAFPPDTMGAAGPTQYIVAVNGRIRTFNKNTGIADGVLNASMDTFFSSVMTPPTSNNFTSDPHIRYDRLSGRWFVVMIDVPGRNGALPNRVMIAVSSGGTITGSSSFTFFYFQHDLVSPTGDTNNFADYPTLGIDANALYIGDNVFSAAGSFVGCSGFVVRKSSILGVGPIVVTAFRGLVPSASSSGPYTPQGVDNYDPAAAEGYFIGVDSLSYGKLMLRRVSTPGGTPTISTNIPITVSSTTYPITVPHLGNTGGTSGYLDAVDDRLFAAHLRNGRLWTAHNIEVNSSGAAISSGGRNGSRWYEIQNLAGTPSVVQSGTVFDSAGSNPRSYWIPTVMVSGQGHAVMGFSSAGSTNYINASFTGRLAGDAAGSMQAPVNYTASSTAYNPSGDTGGTSGRRWGDFSYTSLDPNDDMTMWTIQEFCNAANSYGVRVVKLLAPPPATPSACSPPSIAVGQTNVALTVTGTSVSGSGFFDPGAGFASRLAAAVGGAGITVNSVAYANPTSLTLSVSVAANAALGARAVTVTNPDGQASSGLSLLTVTAAPVAIAVSAGAGGTVSPTGTVSVAYGDTTNFVITADAFSHIASIKTNGAHIAGSPYAGNGLASTNFVWSTIVTDGTLSATFALNTYTLTVASAYGGASPSSLTTNWGTALSLWVTNSPASGGPSTQYVCVAGAVAGNAYAQAGPTNVTLTLTNAATLTWQWQTQYGLSAQTNGSGSVAPAAGWFAAGSNVPVTASAASYWHFAAWDGDTGGCAIAGNVITAAMTRARSVTALFALSYAPLGTPEWWLGQYGLTNGTPASQELEDTDTDGMLAWQEYVAGTDPTNGASLFLSLIDMSGGSPVISWTPDLGTSRLYTVSGLTNLVTDVWGATNAASQFFRVNVNLP